VLLGSRPAHAVVRAIAATLLEIPQHLLGTPQFVAKVPLRVRISFALGALLSGLSQRIVPMTPALMGAVLQYIYTGNELFSLSPPYITQCTRLLSPTS
jgi:hypothetical protein